MKHLEQFLAQARAQEGSLGLDPPQQGVQPWLLVPSLGESQAAAAAWERDWNFLKS